jgi:FMN-dependent NADH-azoreductase
MMKNLLRIDASARQEGSVSREVADAFEAKWLSDNKGATVTVRDVALESVEHIRGVTIQGFYTPKEQFTPELEAATALSDSLIRELQEADTLLISTPIYNFSVPSSLKAWIDQVTRIGVTFGYDPAKGLFGLVNGKKAVVIAAMGLPYKDTPLADMDYLRPYLKGWLNFIGITDVEIIAVESTSAGAEVLAANKQEALEHIHGQSVENQVTA